MDYPSILLLVLKLCGLRTLVLLFQAEQHAHASQHQQHTDAAEQQRTEAAGDRKVEALAVDDGDCSTRSHLLTIILIAIARFICNMHDQFSTYIFIICCPSGCILQV